MNTEEKSRFKEADLQRIRGLRLMDDDYITVCFDCNLEATEQVLNVLLERTDLKVTEVVGQRELKNPNGRSIRLDIHAMDSEHKSYDVEIQRASRGATAQRARFHSSMLDSRLLKVSEEFSALAESYVIFITEKDVLGKGLPMYHVNQYIEEMDELFGDGSHILYVNGEYENSDPVGKLMHDFRCTDAENMNYEQLATRVRYFKESERGREHMCKIFEDVAKEAVQADRQERNRISIQEMLNDGMVIEKIAKYLHITVEEAEEYAKAASAIA
ncbi:MAG: PD-(D/E)XK nuclease family transposase [Lachnospiraceae bacterium]|nr:PD-(D/E)XK nuclease family transposase [Lachnospiraceae bacterium]